MLGLVSAWMGDPYVAEHSSYCPLNLLVPCSVPVRSALTSVHLPCMQTSARGEEGGYPDADKSGQGGRGVNFCYIFADVLYG